jgi:hypothetical protein
LDRAVKNFQNVKKKSNFPGDVSPRGTFFVSAIFFQGVFFWEKQGATDGWMLVIQYGIWIMNWQGFEVAAIVTLSHSSVNVGGPGYEPPLVAAALQLW